MLFGLLGIPVPFMYSGHCMYGGVKHFVASIDSLLVQNDASDTHDLNLKGKKV